MTDYPFAFPAVAIGPAYRNDTYHGDNVEWFRADDAEMNDKIDTGFRINGYASWMLFDNQGEGWRITGVAILPPEGAGWKHKVRTFFRIGRRFRLLVEALGPVPFEDTRARVCAAYANETKLTWEALSIDRGAETDEEVQAMIEGEVARLAEATNLPDLIDRLEDLEERRAAEAH
jgi:hypothetical protein